MATYWPFPQASTTTDQNLPDLSAPLRRGVCHRLSQYLHSQGSPNTTLDCARDTIQHWVQRHMPTPGHHSICGGDFNSLWDLEGGGGGGGGYRSPLRAWALGIGLRSRKDDLPPNQHRVTRPSTQLTGGSDIDHVLYNRPPCAYFTTPQAQTGSGWAYRTIVQSWSISPPCALRNFRPPRGLTKNLAILSASKLSVRTSTPEVPLATSSYLAPAPCAPG